MPRFKHILFPVDYSPRCIGAVPYARELAADAWGTPDNSLCRAHTVLPARCDLAWPGSGPGGRPGGSHTSRWKRSTASSSKRLPTGGSSRPCVQLDDPATAIISFAETNGVDLIMMPTHGYGPVRSFLLGSVAAKVLHDARCPVWTSSHAGDPGVEEHPAYSQY